MALENWSKVFDRNMGYCAYCGADLLASVSAFWSAQRDHVRPQADGGPDGEDSVVVVCPTCHQALSRAKHLTTVAERRAFIQSEYARRMLILEEWCVALRGARQVGCQADASAHI